MSKVSDADQRKHPRVGFVVDVELTIPDHDPIVVRTKNVSDGGLFIVIDDTEMPPVGTEVTVRLKNQLGDGEEPPLNRALVVRKGPDGIGLAFVD